MIQDIDFANPVVPIISVLLGIVILVWGRKLFWLTIGGVGFITGLILVFSLLEEQPAWIMLAAAFGVGAIGAILAILLQQVAVLIAGFLMGAYLTSWLLPLFDLQLETWLWLIIVIIGGVIGSALVSALFEWALVVLSSLVGTTMIVQVTNFRPLITAGLFIILLIIGFAAQSKALLPESMTTRNR